MGRYTKVQGAPLASYAGFVTRAELHQLVDELPDEAVESASSLLRRAADPTVRTLLAAPLDDEPDTPEERAAADAGWAAHQRGESDPVSRLTKHGRRRLLGRRSRAVPR